MVSKFYIVGRDFKEARQFSFVYLNELDAVTAATFFNAPENEEEDGARKVWVLELKDVDPKLFKEIEV